MLPFTRISNLLSAYGPSNRLSYCLPNWLVETWKGTSVISLLAAIIHCFYYLLTMKVIYHLSLLLVPPEPTPLLCEFSHIII